MQRKIVIIGAGMGGLAAGVHALARGWEVDIFEMHDRPGGLCTTWKRDGYLFDGCIRFLLGSVKESPLHEEWTRLGALAGGIARSDSYLTCESDTNSAFCLYKDIKRLAEHISALSPPDREIAREMADATAIIREATASATPEQAPSRAVMRRFADIEERLNAITVDEYTRRFVHPAVRDGLRSVMPGTFSCFSLLWILAQFSQGDGNWPLGGSLALAQAVESKFVSAGGRVHYGKKARSVIIRGNKACGIVLDDGTEVEGDVVVAALDVHQALFELLNGHCIPARMLKWFDTTEMVKPVVHVSLGIGARVDCAAHFFWIPDEPLTIGNMVHARVGVRHFADDPGMSPPGTSIMTCLLDADYEHWARLARDRAAYEDEKARVASWISGQVENRFPEVNGHIETVDVATPVTYERMTGAWKGVYEGWVFNRATCRIRFPQTVPKLKRFYLAGQWIKPGGGLTAAVTTGRETIERIITQEEGV